VRADAEHRAWRVARAALATALAYAAVGWVALMLAGPPGYAAPLYPPAGIALAAVLTWGRPAVLGTLAGAFAVNASLGWLRGQEGLALVVLPFIIGVGAAAQAWVGAWLVHRFVGKPLLLNEPRDIAVAGALGAAVACVTSPSIATLALGAAGPPLRQLADVVGRRRARRADRHAAGAGVHRPAGGGLAAAPAQPGRAAGGGPGSSRRRDVGDRRARARARERRLRTRG